MKIKKVLTALLAAMLLLGTLASCAGESTAITVQLAIYATDAEGEEDVIYDGPVEVDVESPTVLSAVLEAARSTVTRRTRMASRIIGIIPRTVLFRTLRTAEKQVLTRS